jgi:outer membrane protein assembly factor BamB
MPRSLIEYPSLAHKTQCLLILLVAVPILVLPTIFAAEHENSAVGGAKELGYVEDDKLPATPAVEWTFLPEPYEINIDNSGTRTVTPGTSDGIVFDGVVYFGDDLGRLHARGADGSRIWMYNLLEIAPEKSDYRFRIYHRPAVDSERVYASFGMGIVAVSRKDAQQRWTFSIDGKGAAEPVVLPEKSMLFVAGSDGTIYGLNSETGTVRWKTDVLQDAPPDPEGFPGEQARLGDAPARPSGAVTDGQMLFQSIFDQSRVVALDCHTGQKRWSFQAGGWIFARPVATEEYVIIGSQDQHVYCLNKSEGTVIWKFRTGGRIESAASVHGGQVFVASCDGHLYVLDIADGNEVWKFQVDADYKGLRHMYSKPVLTNDAVYFAAGEGQLYAVDRESGVLKWKFRPFEHSQMYSSPATDGQRLFVTVRPDWDARGIGGLVAVGDSSE